MSFDGEALRTQRLILRAGGPRLGLSSLISIIHSDNERSQRIAEKLSMAIDREVHNPVHDLDVDIWQTSAP